MSSAGIVMTVGNAISARRGFSKGWLIPGFVLGGVNLALGAVVMALAPPPLLGAGIAALTVGAADTVACVVHATSAPRLSASAITVVDRFGRLAPGFAVSVRLE